MLVLTRRKGESIILGDDVEVKILELHGSQVKIGVQAPQSLSVHRKEVYLAIQRENKAAAESAEREKAPPEAPPEGSETMH
ncbi:MAG TPA: carbon storage regulator CsrA [Planctomycetota bacterium]|nr:carbon storage regulator CsrA [Planctomycetota bacterium]HUW34852.1 carbon storage regulator CsrA [Planctomycetota bacterium]